MLRCIGQSMVAAGLTFLFRYTGNIRVFATFGDWKYGREKKEKKRTLLCQCDIAPTQQRKEEDLAEAKPARS